MMALLSRVRLTGLRARLLGIVLLAVVPLAGLLFAYAGAQNTASEQRARTEVQAKLQTDANSVRDIVAESKATLVTFGITYAIQAKQVTLIQGNVDRLSTFHPEYVVIAVAGPDGRLVASNVKAPFTMNVGDTAFFKRAVSAKKLVVSGYYVDPIVGRPLVAVSLPVYDTAGALLYVEYVAFDTSEIRSRLSAAATTFFVEELIDASATVVARRPILPGLEGSTRPDAPLNRAMLAQQGSGSAVVAGLDGVVRQYYFAPVFPAGEGDLRLAVGFSVAEYFAAQRSSFGLTLLGFGGVAFLAVLAAWFVGTFSVYRPMRQLGEVAARVSDGDLSARCQVSTGAAEIDDLGRRFDTMAASIERQVGQLERARNELSALNTELEDRVRRRTAELEASNKELEAFNYSVSHDLRAPLRAIDGFSQALIEDYADKLDEGGRDDLARVKAAANRMGELIDSLLALSRLTRVAMDVRELDLSRLAGDVVGELQARDPERDVVVTVQPGVMAKADLTLVRTVLENLLGNAWKFTSATPNASIEFGAGEIEGETVYHVKDNGAGFDMAYSDKLFGAFQRLHDQREFPGTGVGLATVARVIHRHGGRVWAEGTPGQGATFYFTLP
jgi:signal transduction histidine kinase